VKAGKYRLADEAYGELIRRLAKSRFVHLTGPLRSNILNYLGSGSTVYVMKKKRHETEAALALLKTQAAPAELQHQVKLREEPTMGAAPPPLEGALDSISLTPSR
jgi:hypothetical protein